MVFFCAGGETIICFGLHLFCHWIVAVFKGKRLLGRRVNILVILCGVYMCVDQYFMSEREGTAEL